MIDVLMGPLARYTITRCGLLLLGSDSGLRWKVYVYSWHVHRVQVDRHALPGLCRQAHIQAAGYDVLDLLHRCGNPDRSIHWYMDPVYPLGSSRDMWISWLVPLGSSVAVVSKIWCVILLFGAHCIQLNVTSYTGPLEQNVFEWRCRP
jgi:hypothetical protein